MIREDLVRCWWIIKIHLQTRMTPKNIPEMIDIMRQIPEKKRRSKDPYKPAPNEKNKKETSISLVQKKPEGNLKNKNSKEEMACYCCEKNTFFLQRCPDKRIKLSNELAKPKFYKESVTQVTTEVSEPDDSDTVGIGFSNFAQVHTTNGGGPPIFGRV